MIKSEDFKSEFKILAGVDKQVLLRADETIVRHGEGSAITLADGSILMLWTEHFRSGYVPDDERRDRKLDGGGDDNYGRISSMISRDGGVTWGERKVAVDDKDALLNCMSPALTRLADGKLLLAYSWRSGGNPSPGHPGITNGAAQRRVRISADEGTSWSEPTVISPADGNYHTGCHDRAYTLPSGRVLV
ncbi:MAG: Sialidase precursor, partial [Paenibacillus sp.]|nr:Sialidase precursor [Paenibacillus sp.]